VSQRKLLLSIVELGGYPNFTSEYERLGFEVVSANSMRKALSTIKRQPPDVVVAEFNFQSDFRDRTSNLESLLATLQARCPDARVVVFYDPEFAMQFERVRDRFDIFASYPFPLERERLLAGIQPLT
jgi:DNA-binding NtrC family response regulator